MASKSLGYRALNISLGKLLIAAAWVDGELNDAELKCLKNLILRFPYVTFEDWRKLKIYLAYPLTEFEQETIVKDFTAKVFSKGHSSKAWSYLIELLKADGKISSEEREFAHMLDNEIQKSSISFLRKLKYILFQSSIESQPGWDSSHKGREKFIHEFFDNPVYFLFRKAILNEDISILHSKSELQNICLFASILSWFAKLDGYISKNEKLSIQEAIVKYCDIDSKLAALIIKISNSIDVNELQLSNLCSEFRQSSTNIEQENIFISVSKLITTDHIVTHVEFEGFRTLALYLGIREVLWIKTVKAMHNDIKIFE